jgi:hypothetical protein
MNGPETGAHLVYQHVVDINNPQNRHERRAAAAIKRKKAKRKK